MALNLCAHCERHVRERDETCPYCGGSTYAKVRAPVSSATRRAMFAGASVIFVAAAEGASECTVYGALIEPYDGNASLPPRRTPVPDARALTCFEYAGEGFRGLAPTAHRDVCTPRDLADLEAVCLSPVHGTTACADWTSAHPACGRCVFGALPGESAETNPLGALIPNGYQSFAPNAGLLRGARARTPRLHVAYRKSELLRGQVLRTTVAGVQGAGRTSLRAPFCGRVSKSDQRRVFPSGTNHAKGPVCPRRSLKSPLIFAERHRAIPARRTLPATDPFAPGTASWQLPERRAPHAPAHGRRRVGRVRGQSSRRKVTRLLPQARV